MERVERIEGEFLNRAVVPGRKVVVMEEAAPVMIPRGDVPAGPGCSPQVALVRDGDTIAAIDVTCTCGQKIRLRCVYEPA